MFYRILAFSAAFLIPGPSFADTSASYRIPTGTIQIEEDERGSMRISLGPDAYILFVEGRAYLSERTGRSTRVRDLSSIVRRFSPIVAGWVGTSKGLDTALVKFTALPGETQVASFSGQRIAVSGLGTETPIEVVATTTAAAAPAGQLVGRLIQNLADQVRLADPRFAAALLPELDRLRQWQRELGTVLRVADQVELIDLSVADIPAERFTLPNLPDNGKAEPRIAEILARKTR
jgi:hypothetical protein